MATWRLVHPPVVRSRNSPSGPPSPITPILPIRRDAVADNPRHPPQSAPRGPRRLIMPAASTLAARSGKPFGQARVLLAPGIGLGNLPPAPARPRRWWRRTFYFVRPSRRPCNAAALQPVGVGLGFSYRTSGLAPIRLAGNLGRSGPWRRARRYPTGAHLMRSGHAAPVHGPIEGHEQPGTLGVGDAELPPHGAQQRRAVQTLRASPSPSQIRIGHARDRSAAGASQRHLHMAAPSPRPAIRSWR